jgi:hypothetical protein
MGKILRLEEIGGFERGTPVTNENRPYILKEESIGDMFILYHEERKGEYIPYAKFTPLDFMLAKRKQFFHEHELVAGLKREIYNLLSIDNLDLSEELFIGKPSRNFKESLFLNTTYMVDKFKRGILAIKDYKIR